MKATLQIRLQGDTHWHVTVCRDCDGEIDEQTFVIPVVISTRHEAVNLAFSLGQIAGLVHYHDFPPADAT